MIVKMCIMEKTDTVVGRRPEIGAPTWGNLDTEKGALMVNTEAIRVNRIVDADFSSYEIDN